MDFNGDGRVDSHDHALYHNVISGGGGSSGSGSGNGGCGCSGLLWFLVIVWLLVMLLSECG